MALNALSCKNAKPVEKDGKLIAKLYADGNGLYLRAAPAKEGVSRSWVFKYKMGGKAREMGLGTLVNLPLADAREKAAEHRKTVKAGTDPMLARKASQNAGNPVPEASKTFAEVATMFIDGRADGWQNAKHVNQWRNTLATYCKSFSKKPISDVTLDDVEVALRSIWLKKTETATRVLARIVAVINYAKDKQLREDDVDSWGRRLRENRLPQLPKKSQRVQHHPALPYAQLNAFVTDLKTSRSMGAKALQFAILSAARSGEVRLATWSEIDLDAAVWIVPAERMKMKREHRVPLSTQAVELLRSVMSETVNPTDYVFPSDHPGKNLSDMTLTAGIRRRNAKELKWKDDSGEAITVHGFRSTFSTWASETTPFPQAVVEMALAHAVGNKVEAAYRRGDLFEKRRALMQEWANYIDQIQMP